MRVEVTQEDINAGVRGACSLCPVALAIKRVVPRNIAVGGAGVAIDGKLRDLPWAASEFIKAFDAGQPVWPFAFDLD